MSYYKTSHKFLIIFSIGDIVKLTTVFKYKYNIFFVYSKLYFFNIVILHLYLIIFECYFSMDDIERIVINCIYHNVLRKIVISNI